MIPQETLIKTIQEFEEVRKTLNKDLDKETEDTWTLDKFRKWREMEEAWQKLEKVIEFDIKPLTE